MIDIKRQVLIDLFLNCHWVVEAELMIASHKLAKLKESCLVKDRMTVIIGLFYMFC